MDSFITHVLFFALFQQLAIINCTAKIPDNTYREDYNTELTNVEVKTIESQDFEYDPLGLNFEPEGPKDQTEFPNVSEEWVSAAPAFQWTNKPTYFSREAESIPRMLTTSYENDFHQKYAQLRNYSEIFEKSPKKTFVKSARSLHSANYSFANFPGLVEIYEYLSFLEKLSEGRAVVVPLQHHNGTWNNVHTNFDNEILSIRISPKRALPHEQNPIIVVVAGIHASDWYAVQSAIFVSTELILNANRTAMRHDLDWWIIPVLNPDGYEITHRGAEWRDWKKNLYETRETDSGKCFGVDLDLNFEYQWLSCNYSLCDSNYPGEFPFTAPETRGLRDTLEAFDGYCDYFVALKEGKQLLVYPFSDTLESPRNVNSINEISKAALEAFQKHVEGTYDYGQSSHLIDMVGGFIEDWAKVHLGVEKSFAFYIGPTKKDRRELKSQHLMDHMNGIFDLLEVIASGKIDEKIPLNLSPKIYISPIYIALNLLIIDQKYVFP